MNTREIINRCIGKQKELIGKGTLLCKQCGKNYKSYIVNSGDWNRLPPEYRSEEICLDCYKKITGYTPKVMI